MSGAPQTRVTPDAVMGWFPVIVRFTALAGIAHQTLVAHVDRPYLLGLFGAMLSLNEFANAILQHRNGKKEEA